jgi:beta-1,4-N-acetylglucosaminyltransferase
MIYVTVGTMFLDFPRLLNAMDGLAGKTGERVVMQIGMSPLRPEHAEFFDFKPREDVVSLQREARVIVCHAGIGAVQDALEVGKPFVVVPRLKRFNEHTNDHQLDLAEAVQRRGWGRMVLDISELEAACLQPANPPAEYRPAREPLVNAIRNAVEHLTAGRR